MDFLCSRYQCILFYFLVCALCYFFGLLSGRRKLQKAKCCNAPLKKRVTGERKKNSEKELPDGWDEWDIDESFTDLDRRVAGLEAKIGYDKELVRNTHSMQNIIFRRLSAIEEKLNIDTKTAQDD